LERIGVEILRGLLDLSMHLQRLPRDRGGDQPAGPE
jgi:hypothetical protein